MAFVVGEGAVRIFPNAKHFHTELRAIMAKAKKEASQLEVELQVDDRELTLAEKRIDRMDGRKVNIDVHLNTNEAWAEYAQLVADIERTPIFVDVDVDEGSLRDARRDVEKLREENDRIHMYVDVDRNWADDELKDFKAKHDNTDLVYRLVVDAPTKSPLEQIVSAPKIQLPDPKKLESEWNALNFVPKLLKLMDDQFEAGIRRIYDPYVNFTVKLGRLMRKPFDDLGSAINGSNSFNELFAKGAQKMSQSAARIRSAVASAAESFDPLINGVRRVHAAMHDMRMRSLLEFQSFQRGAIEAGARFQIFFTNKLLDARDKVQEFGSAMKNFGLNQVEKAVSSLSAHFINLRNVMQGAIANLNPLKSLRLAGIDVDALIPRNFPAALARQLQLGYFYAIDTLGDKVRPAITKLSGIGHRMASTISRGLVDSPVWNNVSNAMYRIGNTRIARGLQRGLASARGVATGLGNKISETLLPGLNRAGRGFARFLGNSNVLFRSLRAGFGRAGAYVLGFSQIALGAFSKVAQMIGATLLPAVVALGAGLAALGGQAVIGGVLAIGGALVSVAQGAALATPALIGMAGISFAVLKVGLKDVKAGISAAFNTESAEEFEKAIQGMVPSVQNVARSLREVSPAWRELKKLTQERLLDNLGPSIRDAFQNVIPEFGAGMLNIATHWNSALKLAFAEIASPAAKSGVAEIVRGASEMAAAMRPVLANMIAAFGSLAEQGAKFMGPLGQYFADASQRFREWAESLKEVDPTTGMSRFDEMIQSAIRNAGYLKDILGGVFGTLGNILHVGQEGGGGMLAGMAAAAQQLKAATDEGTQGYAQLLSFMQSATAAASQLGQVLGPVLSIVTTVGGTLADFAAGAIPGLAAALGGLAEGLQPVRDVADSVGRAFGDMLASFAPALSALGAAVAPLIEGLVNGLSLAGQGLAQALTPIIESLGPAMEAMKPVFEAVGNALGQIFIAMSPIIASTVNTLTQIMPVVTTVFDLIGQIGAKILEVLAPLFTGHDSVIVQLVNALQPLAEILGNAILNILNALAPVMPVISDGLGQILGAVIPLLDPIGRLIGLIGQALVEAINWVVPLIPPLVSMIVSIANAASAILVPAMNFLVDVIKAAWDIISAVIGFAIRNVIAPVFDFMDWSFHKLADAIGWVVNNLVVPYFNFLGDSLRKTGDGFRWVVDHIFQPAIDWLKDIFKAGVDGIKNHWNLLKKIFADPVRAFIDIVVNKGIVGTWNHINDKFLGGKLGNLAPVPAVDEMRFATGGVMPGYSPGRDPHKFWSPTGGSLALSGGEAIMRPEWTKAVGGPAAVEAMNNVARKQGVKGVQRMLGEGAAYANGGVVDLDGRIAALFEALKPEHGKPYQYGGDGNPSWDCSGIWSGVVNFLNGRDLRAGRLFSTESAFEQFGFKPGLDGRVTIGIMRGGGGPNSHMAGTIDGVNIESAGDHGVQIGGGARGSDNPLFSLHYTLADYLGEFISGGNGGNGGGFWSRMFNKIKEAIGGAFDPIRDQMKGFAGIAGQAMHALTNKVLDGVKDFIFSKIPRFGGGAGSYDGAGGVSGDVESWREMAMEAMRRNGFNADDPAQVNAMLKQIQSESGGNPGISQQIVDVNGTGDSAGVGLLQIIPGTFASYRDPSLPDDRRDPWANMNAALRYYKSRYGNDLTSMWGHGHGYDSGGEALGIGYMPKYTLEPERVLSPAQTRAFNSFVFELMPAMISAYQRQPYDLQEGFRRLNLGIQGIRGDMAKYRDDQVDRISGSLHDVFKSRIDGTMKLDPVDLNKIVQGDQGEINKAFERGNYALSKTLEASADPSVYLAAEKAAKERLEKEEDEARQKARDAARDERKKATEEADKKKQEELRKRHEEELKDLNDEQKKAVEARHKEEDEALRKELNADEERIRKEEQVEDQRIAKLKETGEYYYGYKVLGDDGTNPYAREETTEEKVGKETVKQLGSVTGLGALASEMVTFYDVVKSSQEEIAAAIPAWQAAAAGDPSGLAHNVAVISNQQDKQLKTDLEGFIPGAIAAAVETVASGSIGAGREAPFIGTINTGMSRGELINTVNHMQYQQQRRQTIRTR